VVADPEVSGVEQAAARVAAVFGHADGAMPGREAFADALWVLTAVPALVFVLCLMMVVPALRNVVREPLRAVALGAPLVVAYLVLARPGDASGALHWGALVGMALSVFLMSAAYHGSTLKAPRPAPRSLAT
jgi:hypothetical protein